MEDLLTLIDSNPDPRVLKRALAVKMSLQKYTIVQIADILQVSSQFVSKWKAIYLLEGVNGLGLGYEGLKPYLTPEQKVQVLEWLKAKNNWSLGELECYILENFSISGPTPDHCVCF